jgi:hypothetical protein
MIKNNSLSGAALAVSISFACITAFSDHAFARPISYPEGWSILQTHDGDSTSLGATYTVTKDYALGYRGEYFHDKKWQLHTATFDYLALKKNMPSSQANLYVRSGIGFAHSDHEHFDNKNEPAGYIGLSADWEDRRYLIKYENRAYYAGDIDKSYKQTVRAGITPYIGEYGDVHTWILLDATHTPGAKNNYTITPTLMFFISDLLLEVGYSNHNDLMLNTVFRF